MTLEDRYALVSGFFNDGEAVQNQVAAYLYGNYRVVGASADGVLIAGHDHAGFTLEAITDRLASGLYRTVELVER